MKYVIPQKIHPSVQTYAWEPNMSLDITQLLYLNGPSILFMSTYMYA